MNPFDFLDGRVSAMRVQARRFCLTRFHVVSLISAHAVLAVRSLGISPIVSVRFVFLVLVPIFGILAWGVMIVGTVILVTSLIRPVFSPVSVALVSMVNTFLRFILIVTPCFAGLGLLFRLYAL